MSPLECSAVFVALLPWKFGVGAEKKQFGRVKTHQAQQNV
jgi:hypothetical protein